ncbi:hypothetical protein EMIT043CA1_30395 [Pseudomonas brassicacearum]
MKNCLARAIPYRLCGQTSTIAANYYAPPLVDTANAASAHVYRARRSVLLLSSYAGWTLALATATPLRGRDVRKQVLNRYCRTLSYSECSAG